MAARSRSGTWFPVLLSLLVIVLILFLLKRDPPPPPEPGQPATYLFCFWNVENLFDDRDDKRNKVDEEYDSWFSSDPAALRQKLDHLSKVLLELNHGKGPDILALAEVESVRAAELLREALNARLDDPALHYQAPLMKEVASGRHIAPAVLTRLPAVRDRTQLLAKRLRILEVHLNVNNYPLVVIASHWTSRVSDDVGDGRDKYGDQIYGQFKAMYLSNPQVDLAVCGDFNDDPDDDSVLHHLHATGNRAAVLGAPREHPLLYNLFADKDPKRYGTLYHERRWHVFDQIVVSPGLLDDQGWGCDPDSVRVVNTLHRPTDKQKRPWRFGGEKEKGERGTSDHFPVTVQLRVAGKNNGRE